MISFENNLQCVEAKNYFVIIYQFTKSNRPIQLLLNLESLMAISSSPLWFEEKLINIYRKWKPKDTSKFLPQDCRSSFYSLFFLSTGLSVDPKTLFRNMLTKLS